MTLKDWLELHNVSVAEFAQEIGYSRQAVYQLIKKERSAGANFIRAILEHTDYEVSVQSLLYADLDTLPHDKLKILESKIKPDFNKDLSRSIDNITVEIEG